MAQEPFMAASRSVFFPVHLVLGAITLETVPDTF